MTMDQLAAIVGPWLDNLQEASGPLIAVLLQLLGIVAIDFLSGVYAAVRSGTFNLKYLDSFVKDHIFDKVVPIVGAFVFAAMLGGTDSAAGAGLGVTAAAMLAAYDAATIKSVLENFGAASAQTGNVPASANAPVVVGDTVELEATSGLSDDDVERIAGAVAAAQTGNSSIPSDTN